MEKLKITVSTKNQYYGQALAKGLARLSPGIVLNLSTDEKDMDEFLKSGGVVITDKEAGKSTLYLTEDRRDTDMAEPGRIFKHSPTDLILKAAAALAFDESGESFAPQSAGIKRIWRVFSRQGGAGVTTVSLCLARMLAAERGEKVLYMNMDAADDYGRWVRNPREQSLLPKRQLCYAAEKSLGVDLVRWLDRDEYGVMFFKAEQEKVNPFFTEAEESKLLRCINKSGLISTVVIDEGKQAGPIERETMPRIKEMLIGIERYGDVRRGSMDSDISVMNFSEKAGADGGEGADDIAVNIPEDRESFKETDGGISVDLSGPLGEGIKNLLEEILAAESDSVE